VEISTDGGQTWKQVLSVTGVDSAWNKERIDLGVYVGSTIGLRFRLVSNDNTQMDGWYIDDVEVSNGSRSVAFPWSDDAESGEGSWFADSPWGLSDVGSRSGTWHWTDSPAGNYAPNESASLVLRIDLSGASAPALKFWERYSFEPNNDWGFVEVSTNGGASWTQELFVTGSQASWREEKVDLSSYTGNANVLIRFRLQSNGSSESDGWHLDDFEIVDIAREFPYPFKENFDDTTSVENWLTSSWELMTGGRSAPFLAHDSPLGNYAPNAFSSLTLSGTIDLRGATNPLLTFWHKYSIYSNHSCCTHNEDDYARVYVSPDNGQVWYLMASYGGTAADWTKVSINLGQFVGAAALRVRFVMDDNSDIGSYPGSNGQSSGWWIDDIRVGENLALQALADSVRLEGPAEVRAAPGVASPRLIGRVYEPNVTTASGKGVDVLGEFGVGLWGTMPDDSTWTWFAGGYLEDVAGADRFFGSVRVDSFGVYALAFRASIDGGATWVYGDLDGNNLAGGGISEFEVNQAGKLLVGEGGTLVLNTTSIERQLRCNHQEIWGIVLGNNGPDPLIWRIMEAKRDSSLSDVSWMVPQKTSGSVPVGEQMKLEVAFDATGLAVDSTYRALLLLTSNDAVHDSTWLKVRLAVLPETAPGFTGWVAVHGGSRVSGGTVEVFGADDSPVDTLSIGSNGWFAGYGLNPGTYRLLVHVPGAYPQDFVSFSLPAEGVTLEVSPIHPLVTSPFFMDVYSNSSTYDGQPLPPGMIVTVRDGEGVVCGSYVVATAGSYGMLHVYADDPKTVDVDEGADIGDTLRFFVNDEPVPQVAVYENHHIVRRVDLIAHALNPLHLAAGLHLISLPVSPRDTALTAILSAIEGKYSYVAAFDQAWGGARTYVDSLPEFSDLHTFDGHHGYWLRMEAPGDLVIIGSRLYDDVPLVLRAGWNLISYLPTTALSPERALVSIHDRLSVGGGFDVGAQTYVPGSPFNDLSEMMPGHGYWLYLTAGGTLNYRGGTSPPMTKEAACVVESQPVPTREWTDFYGALLLDGKPAPVGTLVSLADGDGVICGTTVVREAGKYGFLHTYADDPATSLDEGAQPGESLSLLVNGKPVSAAPAFIWQGSNGVVRVNLDLALAPTNAAAPRPWRFAMEEARPNPFNPSTVLHYELASDGTVSMVVYDQLGRRVRTLVNGALPAGRYVATWNGKDDLGREAASGTYFVRLVSEKGTITRRLILLR